jgi:hypothetical protein
MKFNHILDELQAIDHRLLAQSPLGPTRKPMITLYSVNTNKQSGHQRAIIPRAPHGHLKARSAPKRNPKKSSPPFPVNPACSPFLLRENDPNRAARAVKVEGQTTRSPNPTSPPRLTATADACVFARMIAHSSLTKRTQLRTKAHHTFNSDKSNPIALQSATHFNSDKTNPTHPKLLTPARFRQPIFLSPCSAPPRPITQFRQNKPTVTAQESRVTPCPTND